MASAAEILRAARERIEDPDRWVQNHMAVDATDTAQPARSPSACRWCLLGAIIAVTPLALDDRICEAIDAVKIATEALGFDQVSAANDTDPPHVAHPRVLQILDTALANV